MIINLKDKFCITDSINMFIKFFGKTLRSKDFSELHCLMEKIELCVDNNGDEDIREKLPIYLTSAKLFIRNIPSSPLKKRASEIINTVETLTPPMNQYYPSQRRNIESEDEACSLKCVIC